MARHNFREIVLMVLAVLGGLGILLLIGTHLVQVSASSTPAGAGGFAFAVSRVTVRLFALAIVTVVAVVVGLTVLLWRR